MSADAADHCDWCGRDRPYDTRAYLVGTGETFDGLPVVKVKCAECMDAAA